MGVQFLLGMGDGIDEIIQLRDPFLFGTRNGHRRRLCLNQLRELLVDAIDLLLGRLPGCQLFFKLMRPVVRPHPTRYPFSQQRHDAQGQHNLGKCGRHRPDGGGACRVGLDDP